MELSRLVEPVHKALLEASHITALDKQAKSVSKQTHVTLRDLITMAQQKGTPSIKLTEQALVRLVDKLGHRCREEMRETLAKKMGRSLTLVPNFLWADQIEFYRDRVALPRSAKVINQIRADIQGA